MIKVLKAYGNRRVLFAVVFVVIQFSYSGCVDKNRSNTNTASSDSAGPLVDASAAPALEGNVSFVAASKAVTPGVVHRHSLYFAAL